MKSGKLYKKKNKENHEVYLKKKPMSSNEIKKEKMSKKKYGNPCQLIKFVTQVIWLEAPNPEKPQFQFFFKKSTVKGWNWKEKNTITKKY